MLQLIVKNLQFEDGKMIPASNYFSRGDVTTLELTDEEKNMESNIRVRLTISTTHIFPSNNSLKDKFWSEYAFHYLIWKKRKNVVIIDRHYFFFYIQDIWKGILTNVTVIEDATDFFKSGAASMDVVRSVVFKHFLWIGQYSFVSRNWAYFSFPLT